MATYSDKYPRTTKELRQITDQPTAQLTITQSIAPLEHLAQKFSSTKIGIAVRQDTLNYPEEQRQNIKHRIFAGAVTLLSDSLQKKYEQEEYTSLLEWTALIATKAEQTKQNSTKPIKQQDYISATVSGIEHITQLTQDLPENYVTLLKRTLDATAKLSEYAEQQFDKKTYVKKGLDRLNDKLQELGKKLSQQANPETKEFEKYQKMLGEFVKYFPKELEQTRVITRKQKPIIPTNVERGFDDNLAVQIELNGTKYAISVPYEQIALAYNLPKEPPSLSDDQIKSLIEDLEK